MSRLKVAVLISGRGSNLQALIEACRTPGFPAEIVLVLSNNPEAAGLRLAADAGIKSAAVDHRASDSRGTANSIVRAPLPGFGRTASRRSAFSASATTGASTGPGLCCRIRKARAGTSISTDCG